MKNYNISIMTTKWMVLAAVILFFTACSGDKNAELAKMKAEYEKLGNDISKLEAELQQNGAKDSVTANLAPYIEIKKTTFDHYIEVQGRIDGEENVIATSQTLGVVTKVYVKEGDLVKKGQVLAELDAGMVTQTLNQMQSQLVFLTDLYNRQKALWDQKIGSEVQYLSSKNNKENMENQIKTLLEQADMYKIVSPINGTIEEAPIKIGQSMAPGLVAFRVINFSRVKLVSEVAEAYSVRIKKGNEVKITFPDDNKEFNAVIDFTSRYINPVNRTFTIESYLKPGDLNFRANMIAMMNILDYRNTEAIVIPANLIQKGSNSEFVWVAEKVNDSYVAKKKTIVQGQSYDGLTEIASGLEIGDFVLTSDLFNLQENASVQL